MLGRCRTQYLCSRLIPIRSIDIHSCRMIKHVEAAQHLHLFEVEQVGLQLAKTKPVCAGVQGHLAGQHAGGSEVCDWAQPQGAAALPQ